MIFVLPVIAVFVLIVLVLFVAILAAACLGLARGFRDAYHQNFGFGKKKVHCKICKDYGWAWKDKPDFGTPRWVCCSCKRDS